MSEDRVPEHRGSCLCRAVTVEVAGELTAPDACHCHQCRKQSGHFFAFSILPRSVLTVRGAESVTWFQSSERVRRGFCAHCGSTLFWDPLDRDVIAVAMGAFDTPTHARIKRHFCVADKGDYYDITDGAPQRLALE